MFLIHLSWAWHMQCFLLLKMFPPEKSKQILSFINSSFLYLYILTTNFIMYYLVYCTSPIKMGQWYSQWEYIHIYIHTHPTDLISNEMSEPLKETELQRVTDRDGDPVALFKGWKILNSINYWKMLEEKSFFKDTVPHVITEKCSFLTKVSTSFHEYLIFDVGITD